MSRLVEITATIEWEKWRREDFFIADAVLVKSHDDDAPRRFGIKGKADENEITPGVEYRFYGTWDKTSPGARKFGPSFAFQTYVLAAPVSRRGIISYLAEAGKGHGLGPRTAEKLFEKFGAQAVDICREQPEVAAAAVDRWTVEQAQAVAVILQEYAHIQNAWIEIKELLEGRGFPRNTAKAALKRWGSLAPAIIGRDPYKLMAFRGVGFLKCDAFYKDLGLNPAALKRQAYSIAYEVASNTDGSIWFPVEQAITSLKGRVGDTRIQPEKAVELARRGKIIRTRTDHHGRLWIADARDAAAEEMVARMIAESADEPATWPEVEWSLEPNGLPTQHQHDELLKATTGTVGLFCGAPGVGKSWTLSFLIRAIAVEHGMHAVAVAAPTGKAAVRVNEFLTKHGIGIRAKTIHSLLGVESADGGWSFKHDTSNPLPYRFLIVDEASMIDTALMSSLLRARARGTHLLFVGDVNQLPPVGRGAPLRDFIAAGLPYGELKEIHRNAGTIVRACHAIKDGRPFPVETDIDPNAIPPRNLGFVHASKSSCKQKLLELIEQFKADRNLDPIWDVQVCVAVNKRSDLSRQKLNEELQGILNPAGQTVQGSPFRVGDKVLVTKNSFFPDVSDPDDKIWIANGEFGEVLEVHEKKTIVEFDNPKRVVLVPRGKQEQKSDNENDENDGAGCDLTLGFAATTHKMQGSSAPIVIVAIDEYPGATGSRGICDRNWLYTAISRAERLCFLVGSRKVANAICSRVYITRRKTYLVEDIRENLQRFGLRFACLPGDELFDPALFESRCFEPIA